MPAQRPNPARGGAKRGGVGVESLRPLTEAAIQRGLIDAVRALGGLAYHALYAVGSAPGYPDITAVLPDGSVYWFECKGPKGRLSDAQAAWLERLDERAFCVWPDFDRIEAAADRWGSVHHRTYQEALEIIVNGRDIA